MSKKDISTEDLATWIAIAALLTGLLVCLVYDRVMVSAGLVSVVPAEEPAGPVSAPGPDEPVALGTTHFTNVEAEDVTATDDLTAKDLIVSGDASVTGVLTMTGGTTLGGALTVNDNATITGTLDQQGNVADSLGTFTIADNVIVDGAANAIQLCVQGYTTQTSDLLVLEDSTGANVFDVDVSGNTEITGTITGNSTLAVASTSDFQGNVADSLGTFTIADNTTIDGAADAIQLTVQGYTTQTSDLLVLESSTGANLLDVDGSGNTEITGTVTTNSSVDVASTLQYGANDLYPIGFGTTGYAFDLGVSVVTDTQALTLTNITTPTYGFCTLAEDSSASGALCTITISGTSATLKQWKVDGTTAGDGGQSINWMLIGEP